MKRQDKIHRSEGKARRNEKRNEIRGSEIEVRIEAKKQQKRREQKKTPTMKEKNKNVNTQQDEIGEGYFFLGRFLGLAIVESERHHEQAAGSH